MKNFKKGFTHQSFLKKISGGFTSIELLVVVAIICVLTAVILVSLDLPRRKANIAAFKSETGSYITKGGADCVGATSALTAPADTAITSWGSFIDDCANGDGTFSIKATNLKSGCTAVVSESGVVYTGC